MGRIPKAPPRRKWKKINLDQTGTVASGGTEWVSANPPSGKVWRVISMWIRIPEPPGAGSGFHKVTGYGCNTNIHFIGQSDYATRIDFVENHWMNANQAQGPSNEAAIQLAIGRLYAWGPELGDSIRFYYQNQTDVDQTEDREYRWSVIEELP